MTFLGAVASLYLKFAANKSKTVIGLLFTKFSYAGGLCYGLCAICNILVLRHLDYTIVLPATSLTYIWSLVLAKMFLNEQINIKQVAGVTLIISGVILVSLG